MFQLIKTAASALLIAALGACALPAPITPAPLKAEPTVDASASDSTYEWNFAGGDTDGWGLGWGTTDAMAFTGFEPAEKLGLKLTADFQAKGWADVNLKSKWEGDFAPAALRVRVLVPAADGRPRGPLQIGCALNNPWSEAKHWPELKLNERVILDGKEFLAQTVVCRLGKSTAKHQGVVLRFGGQNATFKGTLYLQSIRALSKL